MYTVTVYYVNGKDEQFRTMTFEGVRRRLENDESINGADVLFPDGKLRHYWRLYEIDTDGLDEALDECV